MDQAISLDGTRADAMHLLYLIDKAWPNLIDKAWPNHFDKYDIEETFKATDELTELISLFDKPFKQFLNDEGLEDTPDNFYDYVALKSFELKQQRLLQCIELYHALNLVHLYGANNKGTFAKKFSNISNKDDRSLLREYIQHELNDLNDAIKTDPTSPDNIEKQLLLTQGKTELNNVFDKPTSTDAQKLDFSLDTVVTYALAMSTGELEFATAIAIKFDAHSDNSFLDRKKYLTGLIQHIGKISDSLQPEHNWKVVDDMLVRPATPAMRLN